jgi:hypothetical protein
MSFEKKLPLISRLERRDHRYRGVRQSKVYAGDAGSVRLCVLAMTVSEALGMTSGCGYDPSIQARPN